MTRARMVAPKVARSNRRKKWREELRRYLLAKAERQEANGNGNAAQHTRKFADFVCPGGSASETKKGAQGDGR